MASYIDVYVVILLYSMTYHSIKAKFLFAKLVHSQQLGLITAWLVLWLHQKILLGSKLSWHKHYSTQKTPSLKDRPTNLGTHFIKICQSKQ